MPFLVGLACAANIGSAATLIGNPQNMLIGSVLAMPFGDYSLQALGPVMEANGSCRRRRVPRNMNSPNATRYVMPYQ